MPKFYTSAILLINQSKEICVKQFSVFGTRGGQTSPLMHVPLLDQNVQLVMDMFKCKKEAQIKCKKGAPVTDDFFI